MKQKQKTTEKKKTHQQQKSFLCGLKSIYIFYVLAFRVTKTTETKEKTIYRDKTEKRNIFNECTRSGANYLLNRIES